MKEIEPFIESILGGRRDYLYLIPVGWGRIVENLLYY